MDDLIDLACEDFGGAAILCNDEFFAQKENLLRARAAEWREHEYTERGKWMDGWESRRRRDFSSESAAREGADWCVVRLGLPGVIRRVVVDTAFFRGNFPPECSLEACALETHLDLAAFGAETPEPPVEHGAPPAPRATWHPLVPRSPLRGDSKNEFDIAPELSRRFTHVRLNIFPDGGVARLRVLGHVAPDWQRLAAHGGLVDLAALENGGRSIVCSDMFFGSRNNLIAPGRPPNMSSGWETRRRRGPGNDWNIVQLGAPGTLRRVEVDTTHFKGNAPGRVGLEVCDAPGATAEELASGAVGFRALLPPSPSQPHTRHVFERELRCAGRATHLRLSVFPDGGVARLRAFGEPDVADPREAGVQRLNALPRPQALDVLRACCGSLRWAERMADARPFEDAAAVLRLAERALFSLGEVDLLEAFAAHPRLGERKPEGRWAAQEQAGAAGAGEATLAQLAQANRDYSDKHGFVFLLCATGRSAGEMLQAVRARVGRTRAEELRTAAEEQAKILRLRLEKWLLE